MTKAEPKFVGRWATQKPFMAHLNFTVTAMSCSIISTQHVNIQSCAGTIGIEQTQPMSCITYITILQLKTFGQCQRSNLDLTLTLHKQTMNYKENSAIFEFLRSYSYKGFSQASSKSIFARLSQLGQTMTLHNKII